MSTNPIGSNTNHSNPVTSGSSMPAGAVASPRKRTASQLQASGSAARPEYYLSAPPALRQKQASTAASSVAGRTLSSLSSSNPSSFSSSAAAAPRVAPGKFALGRSLLSRAPTTTPATTAIVPPSLLNRLQARNLVKTPEQTPRTTLTTAPSAASSSSSSQSSSLLRTPGPTLRAAPTSPPPLALAPSSSSSSQSSSLLRTTEPAPLPLLPLTEGNSSSSQEGSFSPRPEPISVPLSLLGNPHPSVTSSSSSSSSSSSQSSSLLRTPEPTPQAPPTTPPPLALRIVRSNLNQRPSSSNPFSTILRDARADRFSDRRITFLRNGKHTLVYTFVDAPSTVVKIFREEHCERASTHLENINRQYRLLRSKNMLVPNIQNLETMSTNRAIFMEKISPIFLPNEHWPSEGSLASLNERERGHLMQLREFFELAVRENIRLNLEPANFGLKNDRLAFFGFCEVIPNDATMIRSLRRALHLWTSGSHSEVRDFLLENIRRMNTPIAQELIQPPHPRDTQDPYLGQG